MALVWHWQHASLCVDLDLQPVGSRWDHPTPKEGENTNFGCHLLWPLPYSLININIRINGVVDAEYGYIINKHS